MSWRRIVVSAAVAACGGKAAPPAQPGAPAARPAAPAPPCITSPDEDATVTMAGSTGPRLHYCIGAQHEQCFTFDIATGVLQRMAKPPAPPDATDQVAHVKMVSPLFEICRSDSCVSLTPNVLPTTAKLRAATNAAGTVAVVLLGDAPKGTGYAEVWDVVKAKRAATFRYARGDYRCGDVSMLGDTIYLNANTCGASPAARAALYTLKGKKIANVGGRDFGAFGNAFAQIDASTWAFLEENGNQLAIQDVIKGKVLKTIDTSAVFKDRGAEMGNPGESALVKLPDGTLVVIAGAPATGNVATIDVATGALKIARAPLCK